MRSIDALIFGQPGLHRRRVPARGCSRAGEDHVKQAVVRFDSETFETIRARAIAERTSFAEQVRLLVEWGLEAEAQE